MSADTDYPGHGATVPELLSLADEYRAAAELLHSDPRFRRPNSSAPFRLLAIHAIELYLNAFLLERGHAQKGIRGLQHNLAKRADLAGAAGLVLTRKSANDLQRMVDDRAYLSVRYEWQKNSGLPPVNRLEATMKEVSDKVSKALEAIPRLAA